jgi:hypothetical protein
VGCGGGVGAGATETPPGARDTGGPQVAWRILKNIEVTGFEYNFLVISDEIPDLTVSKQAVILQFYVKKFNIIP